MRRVPFLDHRLIIGFLVGLTFAAAPSPAKAEYRAFELSITDQASGSVRKVTTVLDDRQYSTYFYTKPTESVRIEATWMCRARSDYFQKICPNPKAAGAGAKSP